MAQNCAEAIERGNQHFGRYHLGGEHIGRAIDAYEEAAADESCAYEAYWRLANLYLNFGQSRQETPPKIQQFNQGVASAKKAIEINEGGKEGHYFYAVNLGSIVEIEGPMRHVFKVRTIFKQIKRALEIDPDYASALVVKACMMHDLPGIIGGSDKKAEELFRRALSLAPDTETPYIEYADFLIDNTRYEEAKKLLDRLRHPDFPHRWASTWLTVDLPKVKKLARRIEQAQECPQ